MSRRSKWDVKETKKETEEVIDEEALRAAQEAAKRISEQVVQSIAPPESVTKTDSVKLVHEMEINHSPNRFVLTKTSTHEEVQAVTGAIVVAKGRFYREGEVQEIGDERPLYLYITAETQDQLNKAIEMLGKYVVEPNQHTGKLYLGIEKSLEGFNIPLRCYGPKNSYFNFISEHSGDTMVRLRGRGSGVKEEDTGEESNEPIHILLLASTSINLEKAKVMTDRLLVHVRNEFIKYIETRPEIYRQFLEDFHKQDYYLDRYHPFLKEYWKKAPIVQLKSKIEVEDEMDVEEQKQNSIFSIQNNQTQQPEVPGFEQVQKSSDIYSSGYSIQEQYALQQQMQLQQQQQMQKQYAQQQQQMLQQQQEQQQAYLQQYWMEMIKSLQMMTPEQYQQYVSGLTPEQQQYLYYYQAYFQQQQQLLQQQQ